MDTRTRVEFVVASDEVDLSNRLQLDRLIEKLQIAAALNCEIINLEASLFEEKNVVWILMDNLIEFFKDMPITGDKVIIDSVSAGYRGVKLFREDTIYLNEISEENILAVNASVWIIADKDSHMPKRPSYVVDKETLKKNSDPSKIKYKDIEDLKTFGPEISAKLVYKHQVSYSDLDYNKHMHNTHYTKLAIDAFAKYNNFDPEYQELKIRELLIKYHKEMFFNEVLSLYIYEEGDYSYIEGRNEQEEVSFAVKMKIDIIN